MVHIHSGPVGWTAEWEAVRAAKPWQWSGSEAVAVTGVVSESVEHQGETVAVVRNSDPCEEFKFAVINSHRQYAASKEVGSMIPPSPPLGRSGQHPGVAGLTRWWGPSHSTQSRVAVSPATTLAQGLGCHSRWWGPSHSTLAQGRGFDSRRVFPWLQPRDFSRGFSQGGFPVASAKGVFPRLLPRGFSHGFSAMEADSMCAELLQLAALAHGPRGFSRGFFFEVLFELIPNSKSSLTP